MTAYNELEFLPIKWDWCKRNGLDLYVIDNMSDDGTSEWLQSNGIPSHQFNTDGAFHLEWLQQEIIKTLNTLKPDWVIYHGADLFFQTDEGIRKTIERADKEGFNLIEMPCLTFYNTGEEREDNPINRYKYFANQGFLTMVHKYADDIRYMADDVRFTEQDNKLFTASGCMMNFGQTKTKEAREQTLARRRKAWEIGLPSNYGSHYNDGNVREWRWNKSELTNINDSQYLMYYESIL